MLNLKVQIFQFDASCGYFSWCDKVDQPIGFGIPLELNQQHALNSPLKQDGGSRSPTKPRCQIDVPEPPFCACGAGKCRYLTMENGTNAGLRYFGCTIKKVILVSIYLSSLSLKNGFCCFRHEECNSLGKRVGCLNLLSLHYLFLLIGIGYQCVYLSSSIM